MSAETTVDAATDIDRAESRTRRALLSPEFGASAGAVLLWIIFAIAAGDRGFLSVRGTASYLEVAAELGILAIAVSLLMIGDEFDLSIGSVIGASGMIVSVLSVTFGWNIWAAILVSMIVAILIGLANGFIVRWSRLPSFIVTLAMLFIVRGCTIAITRMVTDRTQIGGVQDTDGFALAKRVFGSDISLFGGSFAISIAWWILLTILATWMLLRTRFGNWIFGTGGNELAAHNSGVPVNRVKITLFVQTALAAWLIGVIQVVSTTGADVLRGDGRELYAIMVVVIGGTLMTGGYGSAIGASIGALIFGMVQSGMVFAGIDADWFQVFMGGMVLFAVLLNQVVRMRAMGVKR